VLFVSFEIAQLIIKGEDAVVFGKLLSIGVAGSAVASGLTLCLAARLGLQTCPSRLSLWTLVFAAAMASAGAGAFAMLVGLSKLVAPAAALAHVAVISRELELEGVVFSAIIGMQLAVLFGLAVLVL
jgi:hypothetical protein